MSLIFALWPDEITRVALARYRLHFAKVANGYATRPATVHLTLAYTEDEEEHKLFKIGDSVRVPPFDFTLDMADCSPRVRVAWIGADQPPQPLFDLHNQLQQAMVAAGCPSDRRSFRPHITVARDIGSPFEPIEISPVHWAVESFSLIQSKRTSVGAIYDVLRTWPLAK